MLGDPSKTPGISSTFFFFSHRFRHRHHTTKAECRISRKVQSTWIPATFFLHSPGCQHTPNFNEILYPQIIEIEISPEQ